MEVEIRVTEDSIVRPQNTAARDVRVANSPRSRDNRGGQIRLPLARGVTGSAGSVSLRNLAAVW